MEDEVYYIAVHRDWLDLINKSTFKHADGNWYRVGYIEPLVDKNALRLMFVHASAEWIIPNQSAGNMFSKN